MQELIDHGCRTIVLTRGMLLMLHTAPETLAKLKARGIAVRLAETKAAAEIYNDLVAGGKAVLACSTRPAGINRGWAAVATG